MIAELLYAYLKSKVMRKKNVMCKKILKLCEGDISVFQNLELHHRIVEEQYNKKPLHLPQILFGTFNLLFHNKLTLALWPF